MKWLSSCFVEKQFHSLRSDSFNFLISWIVLHVTQFDFMFMKSNKSNLFSIALMLCFWKICRSIVMCTFCHLTFQILQKPQRQLFLCSVGLLQVADLSLDMMLHPQFETRTWTFDFIACTRSRKGVAFYSFSIGTILGKWLQIVMITNSIEKHVLCI